uniref:Uncharacterized protein n=1 Tax=Eutreptiella gymnastica TaxID=73025 RepID=A0A7S1IJS7_9EUGL
MLRLAYQESVQAVYRLYHLVEVQQLRAPLEQGATPEPRFAYHGVRDSPHLPLHLPSFMIKKIAAACVGRLHRLPLAPQQRWGMDATLSSCAVHATYWRTLLLLAALL